MEKILLIPNSIKTNIIKEVRTKYYNLNIKFMSLEEFARKITFDYSEETIYHLMKEYNIKYDTALVYLSNLYYISDKLNNKKMNKLKEIKAFLEDNHLLIYDKYFKEFVKDKEIYIYGYDYLNKYYLNILKDLNYQIINKNTKEYEIDNIYYANNTEDEVIFIADKVSHLLKEGTSLRNIKLIISNEYTSTIKRIFKLYQIPINVDKNSIYSMYISKILLNNLTAVEDTLKEIEGKISSDIYNKIINILNKYTFIQDKNEVKDLIINDLKNTFIEENTGIQIINLDSSITDDDYVFLLGFNKENIPRIYKDNDYFSDKEKEMLSLDTSNELNIKERENTLKNILSIKNLTITYKLFDNGTPCTKSDLIENIPLVKIKNNNYTNSDIINKIYLTKKLDNLVKYNIYEDDLDILYSNYKLLPYAKYDNSYHQIERNKLYKYLDNKLTLAYSSLDNYNRCKFKYYLNNILKINIIKNDFAIIIGNICHYILSNMDNEDFDVDKYYDKYLEKERDLTERELFFLNNIKEEIKFIVSTIKKQLTYTTFDKKMYEEKVFVNKDKNIKVTFMGVIDKVLYKEEDGITYLVVIDYKTGNTSIKLDNVEYGIDLQLPIYLYLSSYMNLKDIKVTGFYLQKLLNTTLDNNKNYEEARENNLKLEGYSLDNEQILSKFDTTYNDSKLIKSLKTTKEGFYKYSKILSEEEIDTLIARVDKKVDSTIDSILEGDFTIDPKIINNENVSCKFCDYRDICYRREKDIKYINNITKEDDTDDISE